MPKQLRTKLDLKAQRMVFVGFVEDSKGYRLWNPSGRKIRIATGVEFNEDTSVKLEEHYKGFSSNPQQYLACYSGRTCNARTCSNSA